MSEIREQDMWARPDNVLMCTTVGHGITTLSGGDVDGDIVFASMNKSLLRLVEATEASLEHLPWDALEEARKAVKVSKAAMGPIRSTCYVICEPSCACPNPERPRRGHFVCRNCTGKTFCSF